MKIAVHSPRASYYCGGAERYILNLCLSLQKINKNIFLITYDSPDKTDWFKEFVKKFKGKIILIQSREIDNNFKKFKDATKPSLWNLESKLFARSCENYYKKNKFDLISLHYSIDCLGIDQCFQTCLHLHGAPKKINELDKEALKRPTKIIAVSNYVLKGWKNSIPKIKEIYVVKNGITKIKLPKLEKTNDLLFFGRLIKTKDAKTLIKSIKYLQPKMEKIKVRIIGEGPEKDYLKKITKDLKLGRNIKFLGYKKDKKLYEAICKSKISVFPSYAKEGVMTTLLEAATLNSAIIVSKACSNEEFIKDHMNGLFFEPKNAKDLSKKIKLLLLNDKLRKRLIKNNKKNVKKYLWSRQAKRILEIYKK